MTQTGGSDSVKCQGRSTQLYIIQRRVFAGYSNLHRGVGISFTESCAFKLSLTELAAVSIARV